MSDLDEFKDKELVCFYCGETQKEIRKEDKKYGYRLPCLRRGTPRGFHSYRYREIPSAMGAKIFINQGDA